ncbi:MAG TPA: TetR/AcrR family transcriptional regulator [Bacillales bacterium]|nr:TetR/AcrR family transcriptional regulator [Bacillales bacterium]
MMKDQIIKQSIQLFESKGFSETSIQDIADALGATKGTFYYYFPSKEQLLMDIHSTYIDDLLRRQQDILDARDKDCKTKLFDMVGLTLKQIAPNGRKAKIFFREMINLKEENQRVIKGKRKAFRFNLQKIVEQGIENGEFNKDIRPDMATFAILGMCNWSYNWFDPSGPVSEEQLTETYSEMLLAGIVKKGDS